MKIVVCVKHVPHTEAKIRVGTSGKTIAEDGVEFIQNPYDELALEKALQMTETSGGEVTVVCVGPEAAQQTLRRALAMGAHKAVWVKRDGFCDPTQTAHALQTAITGLEYDLIFCGVLGIDFAQGQTGVMLATLLNLPVVTAVAKFDINGKTITCEREIESGTEIVEAPLPAVITAQKGLVPDARYPSLKGIMMAKKKPLDEKAHTFADNKVEVTQMFYPPERKGGKICGKGVEAVPELVRCLREEAKLI